MRYVNEDTCKKVQKQMITCNLKNDPQEKEI